jgi:RNA polymerase sigma-70 factor (ECF subfamily)
MAPETPDQRFERLFKAHYGRVLRLFRGKGFGPSRAEELTQDTFERVYRGLEGFREESTEKTWIFTIAENVFRNAVRRRHTGKRDGEEISLEGTLDQGRPLFRPDGSFLGSDRASPEAELLDDEKTRLLREAIEDLPPKMQRCLLLRLYGRRLKYKEIAVVMNVSVETVKSQIHQAKLRLRDLLARHFDSPDL